MSHIHTQLEAGAVFLAGSPSGDHAVYLGCFTHGINDTASAVEANWDAFAKRMWSWGLEPISDEPTLTTEEDDRIFDHYTLREIQAEV
jgi:hypothetical protein